MLLTCRVRWGGGVSVMRRIQYEYSRMVKPILCKRLTDDESERIFTQTIAYRNLYDVRGLGCFSMCLSRLVYLFRVSYPLCSEYKKVFLFRFRIFCNIFDLYAHFRKDYFYKSVQKKYIALKTSILTHHDYE